MVVFTAIYSLSVLTWSITYLFVIAMYSGTGRKLTHMDRYLDFNSNYPKSAKHAVVRTLSDIAKNVCSSPVFLAEEMDHLDKVLKYNKYPKWMID